MATSLAELRRKKEAEDASHWNEEKLRPWAFSQIQENQYEAMVDDLEKKLALGSCMKENYGSSSIDRALGVLDEDLLAQEGQDFVIFEDNEVSDLVQQLKEEEMAHVSVSSTPRGEAASASTSSAPPLPPVGHHKTTSRPSSARAPSTARSTRSSLSSRSSRRSNKASPRVSTAKYTPLYEPRLSMSSSSPRTEATGRSPIPPRAPGSARSHSSSIFDLEENNKKEENHAVSALSHQTLKPFMKVPTSARHRPSSAPSTGRSGKHTNVASSSSPRTEIKVMTPRISSSSLRPQSAAAARPPTPTSARGGGGGPAGNNNSSSSSTFASGLGSLGKDAGNKPSSSLPASKRMVDQTSLLSGELYKGGRTSPRIIYGPNSTSHSKAYKLDLKEVEKNGVRSKNSAFNYKKRQALLKNSLNKFEWNLVSKLDPSQLRNYMKKMGKIDHVWDIFNDPTITKEEQRDLLTSQFQRDFVYSKNMKEETERGPLFPEYAIARSEASQWAECALANGVKVFQSKKDIPA